MTAIWVPVSMQHSPSFFFLFKKAFIFEANNFMTPGKKYPRTGNAALLSSCKSQQLQTVLSLKEMALELGRQIN
ncbi:hypothetical protein [Cytobacillus firmus]|uniref:hypothetical protein n=1 Tax=Cytobacillus firmus TaxID=1399 RepID=UPI00203B48AF|nr:hypothetical protein [Cytobacillus firmus]